MEFAGTKPIQLSFESRRQVVVIPDDEDRFVTTAAEAAVACKRAANDKEFEKQFRGFLSHVHEWCSARSDRVAACYVTVADGGLNVLVCLAGSDYDFGIEDELVALDMELGAEFPLCPAEVLQIPGSLTTESSPEALLVYGDGR